MSRSPFTSDLTAMARPVPARELFLFGRALSSRTRLSMSRRVEAVSVCFAKVAPYFLSSCDCSDSWSAVTNMGSSCITCKGNQFNSSSFQ